MRLLALGKSPTRYTSPTSVGCGGYSEETAPGAGVDNWLTESGGAWLTEDGSVWLMD